MRAIVCKELGPANKLVIEDLEAAALGANDIQVAVKAGGLNFPDTLIIEGKYQTKPDLPFVPGGECAGVVEAIGDAVTMHKIGDSVVTSGAYGMFQEQVTVNENAAFPMPSNLDYGQAAGVSLTYMTSYYALKQRAQLKAGETLLVLGAAGGVGITAVEIGKMMGARVIAAASSEEKLEVARQAGADECINYNEQPLKETIKELTGGAGVNVIYDPVGGDYSEQALRGMAWNGRFLVIGFASGPIPKIPLNLTLLKGCSVVGVFWGAFAGIEPQENQQNLKEIWQAFEEGKLKPLITDRFAFEDFEQAFNCLTERRARGKVILDIAP